jgi:YfiH family protein
MQPTRNKDLTSVRDEQATGAGDASGVSWRLDEFAIAPWSGSGMRSGFLGRRGGVSRGPYESLNLSYLAGDDRADVEANWRRLKGCFPDRAEFVQVHQVHGNCVRGIDAQAGGVAGVGDGMVSAVPGKMLGILTADCVPVLLKDDNAKVVGALHAGWRGVIAGIASAGIDVMIELGANAHRIEAALGPAIGACCFEVDIALARRFAAEIPCARSHITQAGAGKAFIDLKGILVEQLTAAGLERGAIVDVPICTRCAHERFFSRRFAGGAITGLQLSFIGLAE